MGRPSRCYWCNASKSVKSDIFNLPLASIGAAVALWIMNRVVGLPALVGLMMWVSIVVKNAIVL